jgi:hypothetical protein
MFPISSASTPFPQISEWTFFTCRKDLVCFLHICRMDRKFSMSFSISLFRRVLQVRGGLRHPPPIRRDRMAFSPVSDSGNLNQNCILARRNRICFHSPTSSGSERSSPLWRIRARPRAGKRKRRIWSTDSCTEVDGSCDAATAQSHASSFFPGRRSFFCESVKAIRV